MNLHLPLQCPLPGAVARFRNRDECRLVALSGHANDAEQCLLSGAKRTSSKDSAMSAYDPKADIGRIEIPQRGGLPEPVYRLGRGQEGREHPNRSSDLPGQEMF